jgi:hypothetical protein
MSGKKQLQCHLKLLSHTLMSKIVISLSLILIFSCSKKWDPDLQFKLESEQRKAQKEEFRIKSDLNVRQRLTDLESDVLALVKQGLPIYQFNDMIGFKYTLLAQNTNNGRQWERRVYSWEDIVESKWSQNSPEYKLCEKNRDFFIITCNETNIVNIEYF